jgi:hypothetical protein
VECTRDATDAPGSPHYVFLLLKHQPDMTDEEYRSLRSRLLSDYCDVAKLRYPQAKDIVGIASEAGPQSHRSEDFAYLDASQWSPEDEARAKEIQDRLGLLRDVTPLAVREYEYPMDHNGKPRREVPSRNSPCPCGSGKRYKRCHGQELSAKKYRKRSRQ